jgi:hypothetical protein
LSGSSAIMSFHNISRRAKNPLVAERSEGKCVAARFIARGGSEAITQLSPSPSRNELRTYTPKLEAYWIVKVQVMGETWLRAPQALLPRKGCHYISPSQINGSSPL